MATKFSKIIEVRDYHDIDYIAEVFETTGEELGFCCFSARPYIGLLGKFTKAQLRIELADHSDHEYNEDFDSYCDVYENYFAPKKKKVKV